MMTHHSKGQNIFDALMGGYVAKARKMRGLTQTKLAKKIGMGRTSLVKIESGDLGLSCYWFWKIQNELKSESLAGIFSPPRPSEGG